MGAPLTMLAETAADLMTPGPVSLGTETTAAEAARFLTTRSFGGAVVIDEAGHPVGVVTKTDLLTHARGKGVEEDATPIRHIMTGAVYSVRVDTTVRSVIDQFLALNVHHLFVVDPSGVVVGVISPVDVLRKLG